jgi:hypothetical protein
MSVLQQASYAARALTPLIASELRADTETLLSGEIAPVIRDLLETRGIVVFPEVHLSDVQQVAFTKTVGTYAPEQGVLGDARSGRESQCGLLAQRFLLASRWDHGR